MFQCQRFWNGSDMTSDSMCQGKQSRRENVRVGVSWCCDKPLSDKATTFEQRQQVANMSEITESRYVAQG